MTDPVLSVALAWLFFAGTHIGMASAPVRGPLAARLGEIGFAVLFSLVASVGFALLCYVYSQASDLGPAGLALGANPWIRWPLMALSVLGIVCVVGSLAGYPAGAYAIGKAGQQPGPRGFERITRHGFAVGTSMVGLSHALLATRMSGTVFFTALFVFGIVGSIHQDAKLLARNPSVHGPYMAQTSLLPFVAILSGRGRLVLSELRPLAVVLGLLAAWGLREAHPSIFANGGVYVTAAAIGGAVIASAQVAFVSRRRARGRRAASVSRERHESVGAPQVQ
jgi:uncharacterized membrane protein